MWDSRHDPLWVGIENILTQAGFPVPVFHPSMHVLGIILLVYPSLLITLLITASPSDTDEKREGEKQPDSLILLLFH